MSMDRETFDASLGGHAPPPGLSPPLLSLWHMGKDDWEQAHIVAQGDKSAEAAWVHAHLHRIEGDLRNAAYWYDRAGKPEATGEISDERAALLAALL